MHEFRARHVPGVSTHSITGTGCSYSAAIAAIYRQGPSLVAAVGEAKRFVTAAIAHFLRWQVGGRTTDALHHFDPRASVQAGHAFFLATRPPERFERRTHG
jgi:hydroxymethylpyrimidine/phosphomethylpyrimidine kinase